MTIISSRPSFFSSSITCGNQGFVSCGKPRNSQHMHIIFNGLSGGFCRGLEQWSDIHIKTDIGIAGCNNFGSAVVTILAHFGNHDPWLATFHFGKLVGQFTCFVETDRVLQIRKNKLLKLIVLQLYTCLKLFQWHEDISPRVARFLQHQRKVQANCLCRFLTQSVIALSEVSTSALISVGF